MCSPREKGGMSQTDVPEVAALRSVHTSNLPALFDQLHISLLVTTYQAGKLPRPNLPPMLSIFLPYALDLIARRAFLHF